MSLDNYTKEELKEISMVEIAHEILLEEKQTYNYNDLYNMIAEAKDFSKAEKEQFITQLYTDLNIDGRFISIGSNMWGLKRWYPYDQTEEDIVSFTDEEEKPKKKKAKKKTKKKKEAPAEDTLLEDELEPDADLALDDDDDEAKELFDDIDQDDLDDEDDDEDDK
ncbi:DNA-directed RNA polymerase subunit delta [Halalkalibacillus sediminis]|uniref:Probable DNA-directed RNA polymerase subunit delta n=1 Tax=Halalkalibacillus sediminis TaxID=2018042 RepID=A0A2I0QUF2_9BACI|nr:DNA-directed RNA polymerase subunit delta [Halalkalibacillus sediminis]PKR77720.1 DNA-directed RNA polymerase subunit delta [Halalkalibacillus sediminis]